MNKYWCIPPKENVDFIAHMEDILDVYEMPYNLEIPVICMDEKPYQMLDNHLEPLPVRPGDIQKMDSEYIRKGTCGIFIFVEPLSEWRYDSVQERRTAEDWALEIKHLLTECYPCHEKIILVMDILNTYVPVSLYKCFPAPEAHSYAKRFEIHYTPKHGSWLNIAEIELNAMTHQCLSRRLMDLETIRQEVSAWENMRNEDACKVTWHFTVDDARNKLASLYPKFSSAGSKIPLQNYHKYQWVSTLVY